MREDGNGRKWCAFMCVEKGIAELGFGKQLCERALCKHSFPEIAQKLQERYFIDAVVKSASEQKADKRGVKRVGAIDPGSNQRCTRFCASEGVTITEDAAECEKLFALRAKG